MAQAQFKAEFYSGKDTAQPVYLVDGNGNLYVPGGGHVIIDSEPSLPTGYNLVGSVNIADSNNLYKAAVDPGLSLSVSSGGRQTAAIAAAGSANIKSAPGRLARVLVTAAGTAALMFYDNSTGAATGTVIGIIPANAAVGQVFDLQIPAAAGISAVGGAGSPGVTVSYY